MKKLWCRICDRCSKVLSGPPITRISKKGVLLEYCSERCYAMDPKPKEKK